MVSRNKGGKAFVSLGEGETLCAPSHVAGGSGSQPMAAATHVCCASAGGRILTFELGELKTMASGGRWSDALLVIVRSEQFRCIRPTT